jgi:hypothetical protein
MGSWEENVLCMEFKILPRYNDKKFTDRLVRIKLIIKFNEGKISKKLAKQIFKKLEKHLERTIISFFRLIETSLTSVLPTVFLKRVRNPPISNS